MNWILLLRSVHLNILISHEFAKRLVFLILIELDVFEKQLEFLMLIYPLEKRKENRIGWYMFFEREKTWDNYQSMSIISRPFSFYPLDPTSLQLVEQSKLIDRIDFCFSYIILVSHIVIRWIEIFDRIWCRFSSWYINVLRYLFISLNNCDNLTIIINNLKRKKEIWNNEIICLVSVK